MRAVKTFTSFLLLIIAAPCVSFAQSNPWRAVKENSITRQGERAVVPRAYRTMALDRAAMSDSLRQAPMEFTAAARARQAIVTLPKPDGSFERFRIQESPMVSAQVAKEKPDWKTYSGRGIDDPTAVARLSWSNEGLRAYVLGADGAYFVDPYSARDRENYIVYFKHDAGDAVGSFHCELDRFLHNEGEKIRGAHALPEAINPAFSNGAMLRTYRVAIATTGEYTVNRGGQAAALTDVMNAINRINLIYGRDLSVRLTLVSGANTVFPDPNTDPYDNTDSEAQLTINQMQLDTIIGTANYDLGHLFGTGGGGVASSPSVCSAAKAEGYSARVPPTGDPFWVDYVAHEMGHQFSAQHTYNTREGATCSTRSATSAYEVASGATIMSYVGICGDRNLQQFSIDDFHVQSLTQIIGELANQNGGGGTCGTATATNNSVPVANAGANFNIPRQTPFTLTATATDANPGDTLTYSWEEFDLPPANGASGPNGMPANTYDVDTDGVLRPLFRVYAPTTNPARTFPSLPYILNNANVPPLTFTGTSPTGAVCEAGITCVTGENLPTQTRTMNFRVVVRDGAGGVNDAGMQVVVDAASGPFVVTAPNAAATLTAGTATTVTWNVANTTAAPVSAANVRITLSTDGGLTFPTVLAASTPNDGTESVTVPQVNTTMGRIRVEAVGNIFFDISDANLTITGGTPTPTPATLGNISTRLRVETGDNVLIGGFIVTGTQPKRVIVRAIGPSLPVAGKLEDPNLELVGPGGSIATNDSWRSSQQADIIASQVPPTNDLEAAIVATLPANNAGYTAIMRGVNNTTGVGLVEVYDLDRTVDSQLANISTRGLVQTGDNVMIGGFIPVGANPRRVIVRAIGPSLPVGGKLADPVLELFNAQGMSLGMNDDWRTGGQEAEIIASLVPPTSNLESAFIITLPGNANTTAVVRGKNGATGVALVEVFALP